MAEQQMFLKEGAIATHNFRKDAPYDEGVDTDIARSKDQPKEPGNMLRAAKTIVVVLACLAILFGATLGVSLAGSQSIQGQQFRAQFGTSQQGSNTATLHFAHAGIHSFTIQNTGRAAASNVSITASIIYVYNNWLKPASDIRNFSIGVSDPLLLSAHPFAYFKSLAPGTWQAAGDNAVKILLNTLPPGEILTIDLAPLQFIANQQASFENNVTVFFQATQNIAPYKTSPQKLGQDALAAYLQEIFGVAAFDLNASCDNCGSSAPASDMVLIDSTAEVHPFIASTASLAGKITREEMRITGTYTRPADTRAISLPSPLFFSLGVRVLSPAGTVRAFFQVLQSAQGSADQAIFVWPEYVLRACSLARCPNIAA